MTTMTKDQAIAYLHPHVTSSHNDDWKTKREAWDVLMAHLAKGAQVPDERVYAPLPSDADEYDRGHVDGWNACRKAMLSQRGEVES